jgi:hypothetical protein
MSCESFFDDFLKAAEASFTHDIGPEFAMVTNQADGVCSYTTGLLKYRPARTSGHGPTAYAFPAQFEAEHCSQLFSSREFRVDNSDDLALRLTLSDPPRVRLQLNSHGNRHIGFTPECRDGLLVGGVSGTGYIISLMRS